MKRIIGFSALGLVAWLVLTVGWAAASHFTGIPGPGQAAASSMDLTASAVTAVELPGALGVPQRVAARELRRAGERMQRLYRAPERAIHRFLDRSSWPSRSQLVRRSHLRRHVHVDIHLDEHDRARLERRLDEVRRRLERKRRELERRRGTLESVRQRLRSREAAVLRRLESDVEGLRFDLQPLEAEMEALAEASLQISRAGLALESAGLEFALPELEAVVIPELEAVVIPEIEVREPRPAARDGG